ncbi:hypothetical protein [Longimicrobium sp.]|uniref:hypothetical protein n=1 Tax=Longimicrobium sp. TaxID=2029185 RepID=UPI002E34ED2C|nr:hypothetical protein [Longimicrobium sp.]HEX6038115.1 hypothetical protein [Longimicrobium sp.]
MSICGGACATDGSNLLVTGLLVLTPETFTLERLSDAGQRHLRERDPWLLVALSESDREPNACFALERRPGQGASTLASTAPAGITDWRSSERGIAVLLWASPDAGYAAELRPDGRNLVGSGFTWDMSGGYRQTPESIVATYVGPPDLDRCIRVIEDEAARSPVRN